MKKSAKFLNVISATLLCGALSLSSVQAAPITVGGTNFGNITTLDGSAVTFGGSGIPTDATVFSDLTDGLGNTLRLGLSITPRFSAPTPTNDGMGTFTVEPGVSADTRTLWNFSFFAEVQGQVTLDDIGLTLAYDLDSGAGTDLADMGMINLSVPLTPSPIGTILQGSQNITFGFLTTAVPSLLTPPATNNFDANMGEYSFALMANDFGSVGVNAVVRDVSAPAFGIFASLLMGGLLLRRRRA